MQRFQMAMTGLRLELWSRGFRGGELRFGAVFGLMWSDSDAWVVHWEELINSVVASVYFSHNYYLWGAIVAPPDSDSRNASRGY